MSKDSSSVSKIMNCFTTKQFILLFVLTFMSVIILFPYAVTLLLSSKSYPQIVAGFWKLPNPIMWGNYTFGLKIIAPYIVNSVITSVLVVAFTFIIGTFCAHSITRINFKGGSMIFTVILALFVIPGVLTLPTQYRVMTGLGLVNSYSSLIVIIVVKNLLFAIFTFKIFFEQLPQALFDSAKIDGAGELSIIKNIVVPLSLPVFSTVGIMTLLSSWNEFIWPLLLVKDASLRTIPLGLFLAKVEYNLGFQLGKYIAANLVATLPLLIVFFFALKPFMKAMTQGAIKE